MLGIITGSLRAPRDFVPPKSVVIADRHAGPYRRLPHEINYHSLVSGLRSRGATRIVAFHTVGGIHRLNLPGTVVVPSDVIDYTHGRKIEVYPVRHMDMTHVFDSDLRLEVITALETMSFNLRRGGVMGVTNGPRLETPAEIRRMEADGCDLVGMTAMPEAYVAKQMGIPYCSVALVVNKAAGLATPEELSEEAMKRVSRVFEGLIEHLVCKMA